jgi:LCP family protein required for cell wall assembly
MTQSSLPGTPPGSRKVAKGHRVATVTLCLASLALGLAWGVLSVRYPVIRPPIPRGPWITPFGGKDHVNVLLLGVDDVKRTGGLSDTMIVLSLDFKHDRVAAMSIPRDFRVQIPRHGINKINAAYSLGGIDLALETVERLMESADADSRIDHYMACSFHGFKQIVEAMGGVEIDVEKRMRYRDRSQNLYINLYPGRQLLNGEQAMGYVRFRHTDSDLRRIARQQKFLLEAGRQMLQPNKIHRLPVVLAAVVKNVETDLTSTNLRDIQTLVKETGVDNVEMVQLPGLPVMDNGVSYLEPHWPMVSRLITYVVDGEGPRVEVLNGTSEDGLGRKCADRLLQSGYQVTVISNAPYVHNSSTIVDHVGLVAQAKRIGRLLNCDHIVTDGKQKRWADITVIVGRDYASVAQ